MVERERDGLSAGRRLALVTLVGLAVGGGLGFVMRWPFAALSGWDVGALAFIATVWSRIWGYHADETRSHATREDQDRRATEIVLLLACVTCLVGVGYTVISASRATGSSMGLLAALAVTSVVLSWLVVQTIFTLRYARLYYGDPRGGIEFNEHEPPDYFDFAYLAFTVGMTYQVSDTNLKTKVIRHQVLRHAMLSFLFGTVIIAVTINAAAGFLK